MEIPSETSPNFWVIHLPTTNCIFYNLKVILKIIIFTDLWQCLTSDYKCFWQKYKFCHDNSKVKPSWKLKQKQLYIQIEKQCYNAVINHSLIMHGSYLLGLIQILLRGRKALNILFKGNANVKIVLKEQNALIKSPFEIV